MTATPLSPRITAATARKLGHALPLWQRGGRALVFLAAFAFIGFLLTGGTPQSRLLYPALLLTGLLNPVWGLYALALYSPLFLFDNGKTHILAGIEVLVLGIVLGDLRLLGKPDAQAAHATPGQTDFDSVRTARTPCAPWGLWPAWWLALLASLAVSAITGVRLLLHREDEIGGAPNEVLRTFGQMLFGFTTAPEWSLRSLWNFILTAALTIVVARRATPLVAARWLKFGGIGVVAMCVIALLDRFGAANLDVFRHANPDPIQVGRLQGLAGHPGWFAQWIVAMWPGLFLWCASGGAKRKVALGTVMALIVVPVLLLTAARAAWLGVGCGMLLGAVFMYRRHRAARPWLLLGAALGTLLIIGTILGSEVVRFRLTTLFRVSDRVNYYAGGLLLLREYPLGIGLGTHYLYYTWLLPPFQSIYQSDHAAAHSYYLHLLVENGPGVLLLFVGGVLMALRDLRRAWPGLSTGSQSTLIAIWCSALGLLVVGYAQYLADIRVVELALWCAIALSIGICRREVPQAFGGTGMRTKLLLLGAAALLCAFVAADRLRRPIAGEWPRFYEWNEEAKGFAFWTDRRWRIPVEPHVEELRFNVLRREVPGTVTIRWPDGETEAISMQAGESRLFTRTLRPAERSRWAKRAWLELIVDSTWSPAKTIAGSTDRRELGVYITGLNVKRDGLWWPEEPKR